MDFQLVLTTCPNDQVAKEIAEHLVREKLTACVCVNIFPNIMSIYQWENELQCDNETQLLIKTQSDKFTRLSERINELHPYEVVEVIALNIQQGDKHYLSWIQDYLK